MEEEELDGGVVGEKGVETDGHGSGESSIVFGTVKRNCDEKVRNMTSKLTDDQRSKGKLGSETESKRC